MILCVSLNPAVDKMLKIKKLEVGKVNRASLESVHAGGKAINVAYDLTIQGDKTFLTGFVGGKTGRIIAAELDQRHLDYEFVALGTETRTNMNYIDEQGNVTEILEGGHLVDAESERSFITLFKKYIIDSSLCVISGSLPIGLNDDFYGVLIDIAKKSNVPVCLDSSGNALYEGVKHIPNLIKPNLSELENLTKCKYDISKLDIGIEEFYQSPSFQNVMLEDLCDLRNMGIEIICVTLGEKGMIILSGKDLVICKAPKVNVVNTVGSGDSVMAALVHSIVRKATAKDMAVYATALSSAHVTTMNVGDVESSAVSKLMKEVEYRTYYLRRG